MDRRTFLKTAGLVGFAFSSTPTRIPSDLDTLIGHHRHADERWNDVAGTGAAEEAFWAQREGELRAALFRRPTTVAEFGSVLSYLSESLASGDEWLQGELTSFASSMMEAAA